MQPQPLKGLGSSELEEAGGFSSEHSEGVWTQGDFEARLLFSDCVSIHFNVMSPSCHNLYGILTKLLLESSCVCSYP